MAAATTSTATGPGLRSARCRSVRLPSSTTGDRLPARLRESSRPHRAGVALALALLLALGGCGPSAPADVPPAPGDDGPPLQGVVLVLLDTVRPDHLSAYGYERPTSPRLDALAAEGVRCTQVVSSAPWTLPSVASLLAGEAPERVLRGRLQRSLVNDLAAAGVVTAAFTEGGFVSRSFGFDQGFAHWQEAEGPVQVLAPGQPRDESADQGAAATFSAAARWLEQVGDQPFFLLVHTYEAHTPYRDGRFTAGLEPGRLGPSFEMDDLDRVISGELVLSADETAWLTALYDGDIAATDAALGTLLDALETTGLDRRSAVLVTSDHGEELGRHYPHNTGDHGHALLDPLMLVPLIVRAPGLPAGSVVDSQVRLLDLLPTALDLLGLPAPGRPLDGASLEDLLAGGGGRDRPALLGQTKAGPFRIGLRHRGHKYVLTVPSGQEWPVVHPEPPARQLYDLTADPHELENLVGRHPQLAAELEALLTGSHPGRQDQGTTLDLEALDQAMVDRLRSLGYLR